MPAALLPASAAAFAPRSAPTVVLNSKVEPWLTATLKRTNRVKRPLNSVPQHVRCLTDTLSSASAIWTLCSLMLPKAPEAELRRDTNPLVEAIFNYQLVHVDAYVVHVDMVLQNEVAFKLTPEAIEALIEYHRDIYTVDMIANTWDWSEKDAQVKKLRAEFVQAINRFVYRTSALALEGMEDDGAGELMSGRSDDVKEAIMGLFVPLLPPPPRVVEIVRPVPLLPSSPKVVPWWQQEQQQQPTVPSQHLQHQPAPVDPWKIVPSSPSTTTTTATTSSSACDMANTMTTTAADMDAALWASISSMPEVDFDVPSPTPSYSPPFSVASPYYDEALPIPQMPFPSLFTQQQCAVAAGFDGFGGFGGFGGVGGFGGFGWDRYQDFVTMT
ncbi:MAG: hypothetical protein M1815_001316 [Lichina confinis]|nr:MAG: hypothetical protein M1815_001316 [Lichina confinis]